MEIRDLKNKIKEISLVISRVPRKTKDDFVALANAEFCGDYGMCLKWCVEQAMESQTTKALLENISFKMDYIIGENSQSEEKPETNEIKMVNGRIVKKEVKKNE